jgi:two-component system nitrate/nitrite response regulator NarL
MARSAVTTYSWPMTVRTLLVDDNKTFLTAVRNFLHTLPDIEVVGEAHNGAAAVEMAGVLHPDLVLLDIVMPEMNGLEAAQALGASACPPRIVFLSMHDSETYRTAARELNAFGYVGKGDFVMGLVPLLDQIVQMAQTPQAHANAGPQVQAADGTKGAL